MAQPDLDEWRLQARAWLAETLPRKHDAASPWGVGVADFSVFRNLSDADEESLLAEIRRYRQARYDAGYGAITLPAEAGGAGLSPVYAIAFAEEESSYEIPTSSELISVTTGLVGPSVALFGTDEQRELLAKAFLRTDLLACQLFSEPGPAPTWRR